MKNNIFRKAAMEKISSPDALDRNIKVVSMRGWLALIAAALLIIITIVWSFVGSISTFIDASGIVMYGSGIENIIATEDGMITDLNIETGDIVNKNTAVVRIDKSDIAEEINSYEDCCNQIEEFRNSKFKDISVLSYDIYSYFEDDVFAYNSAESDSEKKLIYDKMNNMCDVLVNEYTLKRSKMQEELFNRSSVIVQSNGKVLEVYKKTGDYIHVGDVIASMIVQSIDSYEGTESMNNEVIVYVPVSDGKKISKGMEVQVIPSTVDKEKYGCIIGSVKSVSEYAVSEENMMSVLNNELLVENISTGDALIEVHIELLKDNTTVSKYKWTTKNGAPVTIAPGTVCSARIEIGSSKPVEIVFPFIKNIIESNSNTGEQ